MWSKWKRFATTAGSVGIWILENKPFSVQAAAVFERGPHQIQETFFVNRYFYAKIFKDLVVFTGFIVEIKLVTKAWTATTFYTHSDEIIRNFKATLRH